MSRNNKTRACLIICLVLFRETWIYDFMTFKCIPTATEMFKKKTTFHNIADLDGNQNCPSRKTIQLHAFRGEVGGVTLKSACLQILSRLSLVGE